MSNLNYVKNMAYHPCQADGSALLYIETGLQAALPLLFAFNTFSCLDIIKARAGISWKCGRALKALIEAGTPPKTYDNVHFLYSLGPNLVERALWYMFVAELASDFVVNWTSLIYAGLGCTGQFHGGIHCGLVGGVVSGDFGPVLIGGTGANSCGGVGGRSVVALAGCTATISYDLQSAPYPLAGSPPYSITSWVESSNGEKSGYGAGSSGGGSQTSGSMSSTTQANPALIGSNTEYTIRGHCSGIGLLTGGSLDVYLTGHSPKLAGANCLSAKRS